MSFVLSMLTSKTATLLTLKEPVFTQTKMLSDPDFGNKLTASLSQGQCFCIVMIHNLF
ncbi:hypothetical protein GIB67_008123 [Kingdonia uniflora]|uniref:Uncharacterized protein n=1 Tax=Kingdonia uniflora TaxID=39325 RepID=A0A7J7MT25_9MAGN|nr:hypothetical protein GIB67_008123 [Kingdonia uniflora]